MRDVMFLLAVYGAVLVWRKSYLPWLKVVGQKLREGYPHWQYVFTLNDVRDDIPPLGQLVVAILRNRYDLADLDSMKPWSCPLCMSFIFGLPLYPFTFTTWSMVPVAALAAVGGWRLFEGLDGYNRTLSGSDS